MKSEFSKSVPKLLASICVMAISISTSSAVEIVAHRGASFDAPENTLASMKLAWKQNADAIETDIHLSKDGKLVVLHDFDTERVSGVDKKNCRSRFQGVAQTRRRKMEG